MAAVFSEEAGATSIKSNKAIIKIGSTTALALNVQITFQRQVEIVPTIGEDRVISVGMPQGQFSIESLIGHDDMASELEQDGCTPTTVVIENPDECGPSGSITCDGVVLSAVTITAQGGRGYIAHNIQGVFTKLTMDTP